MANYWVITIGINQYRHLQPLTHAQNDALYIHRFFTEEAGIPLDQCVLLSDLSTSVGEQIVYPDKPTVSEWVQNITHKVQADDVLWFFFSGYGAQVEGEDGQKADYLMPIDGDPGQVEKTGLSLSDLIDTLAGLPTDKVLLALDFNRSQGTLSGQSVGEQVIELAGLRKVPTLLSCQPEQYSHGSIFGIRPGLFAATLLEAMRQNCQTAEQISDYLAQRLPELCKHHLRPIQNPVSVSVGAGAVSADENRKLLQIVPDNNNALNTVATEMGEQGDRDGLGSGRKTAVATGVAASAGMATATVAAKSGSATSGAATSAKDSTPSRPGKSSAKPPYTEEMVSTGTYRSREELSSRRDAKRGEKDDLSPKKQSDDATAESMAISGAKLRNWGLLTLAILMGGVLLKQPFVGAAWNKLTDRDNPAVEATENGQEGSTASTESAQLADAETSQPVPAESDAANVKGTEAEASEAEGTEAKDTEAKDTEAEASVSDAKATSEAAATAEQANQKADQAKQQAEQKAAQQAEQAKQKDAAAQPTGENAKQEQASAQALMTQANKALEQRQYTEALIALQQVPRGQRDEKFSSVLTKARAGAAEAEQTNASVLTEARTAIQPTQASQFSEAITKARKIQPGEPFYDTAQNDILSWSQVILDIAKGRATSGNLEGAIAAAKVMPADNAEYHQKAKESIAFWQQRQQSRNVIAQAQEIPKPGQASTYQKGIVTLREVPIEHPEYENAQRLADQWSESIFSIAQARAAQGRESAAIQAAVLVPAGTVAYEPTQQAIRRWRAAE